ncbi:MAG TPA: hypothetical protein VFI90_19040 [Rubrobacter sp.]|nr:hypothetical protein [Rubrobacter sp.]
MSPGMVDRLNAKRHRRFVGRVTERDHFRSVLASEEPPFNVLYVWDVVGLLRTGGVFPEL